MVVHAQCDPMPHLPAALFLSDVAWSSLPSLQECSKYHDKTKMRQTEYGAERERKQESAWHE